MDLVKSIRNALQFISSVQDSCDKHRKYMEHIWLQEYTSYITEWKQSQIELKKHIEKKSVESNSVKDEDVEELEELALADLLLRKAKSIRMKNQKTMNGIIDKSSAISGDLIAKSSSQTSEKNKIKKQIPQSKSDYIISKHKSTIVPRSKSAFGAFMSKESKSCYNSKKRPPLSAKCSSISYGKPPDKTSDDLTVISSKDLDVLKRLHVTLPTCREIKPKTDFAFSD